LNFLITGGCGFIGVNLIKRLLEEDKGRRIRVFDNLSVGKREDLALIGEVTEITKEEVSGAPAYKLELLVGDVRDEDLAKVACQGADIVVHLAASTGVIASIEHPVEDCTSNVLGTLNCLEAARLSGVRRFLFASSGAPLGEQEPPIHEDMVPHPISPYGASKLAGEGYCAAYYGSFGLDTVALRFGNVYGPHSNHKGSVVAKFIRHILNSEPLPIYGDGRQTRDFIYVDDLVQAIGLSLDSPDIGGQIFQVATHKEHTVLEVAEELNALAEKYLGRKSEIFFENERKGEIKRNYSDISKARKMLGFEPKYDLKEGLEKTFCWFLQNQQKYAVNSKQ
jgi:UDP-glucose 4-epimerase